MASESAADAPVTRGPVLELKELRAGYGENEILKGVNLSMYPGEIVAVIGANGAGKSSLLKAIFGLTKRFGGSVLLHGHDISRLAPEKRLLRGVALVPQGRCNFPEMTVRDNLVLGGYLLDSQRLVRERMASVEELFPTLTEKRAVLAGNMSGGEQQLLETGMAMMLKPDVLLIDEPSLGLAPIMQKRVFGALKSLSSAGVAVLLVEQNAVQALEIANRGVVVEQGKIGYEGSGPQMLAEPDVRRAYLGLSS